MNHTAQLTTLRALALDHLDLALAHDPYAAKAVFAAICEDSHCATIDRACAMVADHMLGVGEWTLENDGEVAVRNDRTAAIDLSSEGWPQYIDPRCELDPNADEPTYRAISIAR